ncbi:hypothetical protein ART_1257 [Arthrobacter sp. PAMC 25486]|uniref:hypothetical protein n=1 Tax=Arthrobacter sp. PAMC 25486 TaxID=1494608 RepID=UPI0005362535|nr:hypothetical protein [Arthrobacter sp. PAMC 25486]AIY00856.1 hypothetical protein ART_1257 [Arthrobacter sp. PAMC 25486]
MSTDDALFGPALDHLETLEVQGQHMPLELLVENDRSCGFGLANVQTKERVLAPTHGLLGLDDLFTRETGTLFRS